jgi:hypothetical protein
VKRLAEKAIPFVLAAIILAAVSLALYWVFLVPMLQAPDEPIHLHTAFNVYSAGKLVSVREPLHSWNSDLAGDHVYITYLEKATNAQSFVFHYSVKVPPDYGTRDYYAALDRNAPTEDSGDLEGKSRVQYGLLTVYPCGYYAALAGWLRIASIFTKRVTSLFFAARMFSVFLLAISLSLMYFTLRELKLGSGLALMLTAIVGFFPMTTFVSSYAQADNLTLTMVMLCCYLALRVKRSFGTKSLMILLGLALGTLYLTKYHFFAAVFPAVIGLVAAENLLRRGRVGWLKLFTILLIPVLVAILIQTWITWGADPHMVVPNPSMAHVGLNQALAHGRVATARYLVEGVGLGFSNFYLNGHTALTGSTFNSFWGDFGWTDAPLVIFSPWKTNIIRNFIAIACVAVFVLTIVRIGQVILRVWRVAKRGRRRRALSILFSNPLLNGYFIFTVMMFGLFMVVRRSFAPQGRNWFPFILAIFLNAVAHAPKALGRRRVSTLVSGALFAGLALYCILGSCYAIPSIVNRYYNVNAVPPPYSVCPPNLGKQYLANVRTLDLP